MNKHDVYNILIKMAKDYSKILAREQKRRVNGN